MLSFRSLYTSGETKLAIFGDMGMMSDGNTLHGNLLRDNAAGLVDAFVHMGDHAYQVRLRRVKGRVMANSHRDA